MPLSGVQSVNLHKRQALQQGDSVALYEAPQQRDSKLQNIHTLSSILDHIFEIALGLMELPSNALESNSGCGFTNLAL